MFVIGLIGNMAFANEKNKYRIDGYQNDRETNGLIYNQKIYETILHTRTDGNQCTTGNYTEYGSVKLVFWHQILPQH